MNNRHRKIATLSSARGFSVFELLIALAILGLLLASIIPAISTAREASRRADCAKNLYVLRDAMKQYSFDFGSYPRVKYDEKNNPNGWTSFTGPDDANPFAPDSSVQANDVTASMWLLVRGGYVTDTLWFICPSSADTRDTLRNAAGMTVPATQRGNFRSPANLSYSMFSPFSSSIAFVWNDTLKSECAILADKTPGVVGDASGASPEAQASGNSPNHRRGGQNVLYADASVRFETNAYVGAEYKRAYVDKQTGTYYPPVPGDNIYTALTPTPLAPGDKPPVAGTGVVGKQYGPAWLYDSYLVP